MPYLSARCSLSLRGVFDAFLSRTSDSASRVQGIKTEMMGALVGTGKGKASTTEQRQQVQQLFEELEQILPAPEGILRDRELSKLLEGPWFLQYTAPEGFSTTNTKPVYAESGTVTAAGVSVDTSESTTTQTFDCESGLVENRVSVKWPWGGEGSVAVMGTFEADAVNPRRALVQFNCIEVVLGEAGQSIKLKWPFQLIGLVKGLKGETGESWLETTFVDRELRLGRGDKGTLFVLTRQQQ